MKVLFQDLAVTADSNDIERNYIRIIETKVIEVASDVLTKEAICGILAVRYDIPCEEAFDGFNVKQGPNWISVVGEEATYLFTNMDAL